MSNRKQRLDRLESQLTPRQAVLLWMAEAHSFESVEEYALQLKTLPDSAWPLHRLGDQMADSVKQAMQGRSKEEINRALRSADLDVLFLFFLHQQVDGMLLDMERYVATYSLMPAKELAGLTREQAHNNTASWNRTRAGLRMPYPVDQETAQAVDAAMEHHVIPWEVLKDSDEVAGSVTDSFLAEGKTDA